MLIGISVMAQQGIKWNYTAKKISGDIYDVHLTARIANPWHLYSQHMKEGGPIPTSIRFASDSLLVLVGVVQEKGNPVTMHEQVFNVDVTYYTDSVDFVQRVKLKKPLPGAKTSISGTIEFMICTDEQCLPPATVSFKLPLE